MTIKDTFSSKKFWIFCLILSLLVSAGCSRFMYNRAGWLASWYVDDYIDFTRIQKKQFKVLVKQQHDWHRRNELPRYKAFLEAQKQFFSNPDSQITPQYMESITDAFLGFGNDFMLEALPKMIDVLSQLSDEQVAELLAELKSEQKEMEELAAKETQEEIYAEREREMQDSIKRWFGKLEPSQKKRVAAWARDIIPVYDEGLAQRKVWMRKLEQALSERHDIARFTPQMKTVFVEPSSLWPKDYREKMELNSQKTYVLLAQVAKSATPKQLAHLDKTLSGYIKDLDKLNRN